MRIVEQIGRHSFRVIRDDERDRLRAERNNAIDMLAIERRTVDYQAEQIRECNELLRASMRTAAALERERDQVRLAAQMVLKRLDLMFREPIGAEVFGRLRALVAEPDDANQATAVDLCPDCKGMGFVQQSEMTPQGGLIWQKPCPRGCQAQLLNVEPDADA